MSVKDEKPTPHHNYHPIKILGIILVWTISLYIALVIIKNYDADLPSESTEFSRPHLIKNENICKSPECITLAHQLHNWQDISVDPCQDFYQAACGKYNEQNTVKGTRFQKAYEIILNLVTEHLEKNLPTTSKSEQTMKVYYQKCKEFSKLDKGSAKNERYKEIFQTIKKIGPWPMVNRDWNESEFDLNDMMSNMASFGKTNFGLFAIQPTEDFTIEISQSAALKPFAELPETPSEDDRTTFIKELLRINNITFDKDVYNETDIEVGELLIAMNAGLFAKQVRLSGKTIGFTEIQLAILAFGSNC